MIAKPVIGRERAQSSQRAQVISDSSQCNRPYSSQPAMSSGRPFQPQRRDDRRDSAQAVFSALIASQFLGIAQFEQDLRGCNSLSSLRSSRLCGFLGRPFWLRLRCAVSLRFDQFPLRSCGSIVLRSLRSFAASFLISPATAPRLATVFLLLALTGFARAGTPKPTPSKPNIILVLTDDLGWGDVGVLFQNSRRADNSHARPCELTPNLDTLAAQGVQLRNHYCPAPVCAPSRASLMLGVTQGHANIRNNEFDKALENNHTLATVLNRAGYETVAVGKWGLQGNAKGEDNPATWPAFPTKRGFAHFFGYARHKDGHEHYPKEGLYDGPKEVWDDTRDVSAGLDRCYTADLWTAWTKQWLVNHQRTNSAQPFFIYLAYDTPHAVTEYPASAYPAGGGLQGGLQWLGTPGHAINTATGKADSYVDPAFASATWHEDNNPANPEVPWPDIYKRYATSVRRIDLAVGDLLQLLKDLNIDSNTVVCFSSDNGPAAAGEFEVTGEHFEPTFFSSYGPFDGIKRDCWEGGVRVPMLVRWPGHIPAGKIVTRPSALYDLLPTFADLAGLPAPARADGVSLVPEWTGTGVQRDRGYVYVEYYEMHKTPSYKEFAPNHRGRQRNQMQVLRMGDFLGVRYDIQTQADNFEIYNMTADPQETKDLAAQMPALEQRMKDTALQVRRPNHSARRPYDDALVPAIAAASSRPGVDWRAYEGAFPWVPDLEAPGAPASPPAVATGSTPHPDLAVRPRDNDIGLLFSGCLNIHRDGEYIFHLRADTGAVLRIHDATVIDADFGYTPGKAVQGAIKLHAGWHPFRLFYAHGTKGQPSLNLTWTEPGKTEAPIPDSVFGVVKPHP
jgi:arylsulfatase A-like enzyme